MFELTMLDVKKLIPERIETPKRYELNAEVNKFISDVFEKSKGMVLDFSSDVLCERTVNEMLWSEEFFNGIFYGDIPYRANDGKISNLRKSGSAVFCVHQGLQKRHKGYIDIVKLADEIEKKDYYDFEKNNGTYNNLFDHLICRRCSSVFDVIEGLKTTGLITLLVKNSMYYSDEKRKGSRFLNLVGLKAVNGKIVAEIDDCNCRRSVEMDISKLLLATRVAWMW